MQVTRRQALRALAAAGITAGAGTAWYGAALERRRIGVTRLDLACVHLPDALVGLRIGLLSDIHLGRFLGVEDVAAAAALLRHEHPDLIVLAGDYVTSSDRKSVTPCAEALEALDAPLGRFAVIGNHDPEPTVNQVFRRRGIQLLRDEHTRITVRGETVSIGGLRYWSRKASDVERAFRRAEGFRVLVAHDPRRLAHAAELGIPLVLSGHTHGGQVVLPGIGAPAAAGRFPVVSGVTRRVDTTLFVSRGVGTVVVPVRLNCPPEVAVLTLKRAARSRPPLSG